MSSNLLLIAVNGLTPCQSLSGGSTGNRRSASRPYTRRRDRPRLPSLARSRPARRGRGARLHDPRRAGREYLDAAGGAIVVNVGHGRASIARVLGEQAGRLAYAHGSRLHDRAARGLRRARSGRGLPVDDPAIYPVSGGSEAIETALKLARAYHLARGEPDRGSSIARWGSYHGNTLGALDLSGRRAAAPAVRAVARPVPARLGGLSVPRRRAGAQRPRRGRRARRRAGSRDSRRPARDRRRLRRRADRRRDARGRRPA